DGDRQTLCRSGAGRPQSHLARAALDTTSLPRSLGSAPAATRRLGGRRFCSGNHRHAYAVRKLQQDLQHLPALGTLWRAVRVRRGYKALNILISTFSAAKSPTLKPEPEGWLETAGLFLASGISGGILDESPMRLPEQSL